MFTHVGIAFLSGQETFPLTASINKNFTDLIHYT